MTVAKKPRLLIVGEAWGAKEEMFKHALVDPTGAELARMLQSVGFIQQKLRAYPSELDMIRLWQSLRENNTPEIYVTNVFQTRPPNNEVDFFFDKNGDRTKPVYNRNKFVKLEYSHFLDELYSLCQTLKPNLILALGNTATWALLNKTNIAKIRGTVELSRNLNIKVLPTYHPAAVLRDWSLRTIVLSDLQKALREVQFPEIKRIERFITCHDHNEPDPEKARLTLDEIKAWTARDADYYAIDIESGYALYTKAELNRMTQGMRYILSSQISMIGFARSPSDALVIPFMTRNELDLNYWKTVKEEKEAWKVAMRLLASPQVKIFQNGMYDIGRFLSLGIRVNNAQEDTMLRHHALYPELLKSLGFLGSIYSNEMSWKTMYDVSETLKKDE